MNAKYELTRFLPSAAAAACLILLMSALVCAAQDAVHATTCITSKHLPAINKGISIEELRKILEQHRSIIEKHFGAPERTGPFPPVPIPLMETEFNEKGIQCFSSGVWSASQIHGHEKFYFLFRDHQLQDIVVPPHEEFRTVVRDGANVAIRAVNPQGRIDQVLKGERVPFQFFLAVAADKANEQLGPPDAATVAAMREDEKQMAAVSPEVAAQFNKRMQESRDRILKLSNEMQRIRAQYDPQRLAIGMTRADVDKLFGAQPNRIASTEPKTEDDGEIAIYGEDLDLQPYDYTIPRDTLPWVAVKFVGDHLVSIYSGDFFDPKWIESN